MLRTHTCNDLTKSEIWKEAKLSGWVSNRRDHWWIIFVDLRDRYWITQVVFDPAILPEAENLRSEFVITVTWEVRSRPEWQTNSNLNTWAIELEVKELVIQSKSKTPPFEIDEHWNLANEEIRYKHRYIDLRRKKALENITFRSKFLSFTRNWFTQRDFLDVQTPIFTVSSPEWARDFVIPSRIHPGKFYALPQAPQQYKQLLMVWWIDKYFQIAPCFRDEDPRADRHACEFYQIDCEMSFVEQEDVFEVAEGYIKDVISNLSDKKLLDDTIYRMTFKEALDKYGSDKPDIRFGLEFVDLTDIFTTSEFAVFKNVAETWWVIKSIKLENTQMSRKEIDELTKVAQSVWAKGLAYIIYDDNEEGGKKSPILKFMWDEEIAKMEERLSPKNGDIIFFSADEFYSATKILWTVRLALRDKYNLANKGVIWITWVTDFPMFEEEDGKIDFGHNPFSMPKWGIKAFDEDNILEVPSVQYDMAVNGFEVLSGSIRNHDIEAMVKAFEMVWRDKQEVMDKFGAMYEAFQYGVPPHWGFAFGFDRLMMILMWEDNIREIYAFPKSWKAQDLMMNAPAIIDESQLDELHINIKEQD